MRRIINNPNRVFRHVCSMILLFAMTATTGIAVDTATAADMRLTVTSPTGRAIDAGRSPEGRSELLVVAERSDALAAQAPSTTDR